MNNLLKRTACLLLALVMCIGTLPTVTLFGDDSFSFTYYYRSSSEYTSSEQTINIHFVDDTGTEITDSATISGSYSNSETNPTIGMDELAEAFTVTYGNTTYNFANSAKIATSSSTTYANATTANYIGYNRTTSSWRYSTNGVSFTALDSAITDVWLVFTDDSVSTTYDGETVDHIDIEVDSTVTLIIDGIEYSADVELEASDFIGGNVTLTAWYNYQTYDLTSGFYTMEADTLEDIETSTSSENKNQYRVNGTYPVGTILSPVYYLFQLTKEVELTAENGHTITVTIDFTSEWFWYWSTENHCPALWQSTGGGGNRPGQGSQQSVYDQWQSGSVIDGSGLDFVLSASAEQVTVVVSKYIVDTDFNVLDVEEETVYYYSIKEAYGEDGDTSNDLTIVSGNLTVEAGEGYVDVTKTVDVGEYYVTEDSTVAEISAKVSGSTDDYSDYTYVTTYYGLYDDLLDKTAVYTSPDDDDLKLVVGNNTDTDHWVIYNVYSTSTIDITVTKVWDDGDDQDGIRPDEVTVTLYKNGETTGLTGTLNESNSWTYTFEDLAQYANGSAITYTVIENSVPSGYEVAITGTTASGQFTVTNTHVPETTSVSVTKVWDDNDDQDGIRPDDVTVTLYAGTTVVGSVTLSESNSWTYTWTDLDKYSGGELIKYTVTEDTVSGYETEITGSASGGYTITNTHTPETVDIHGYKIWDDASDQDGKRPDSITIYLYAGTTLVATQTVTPDQNGDWYWDFTDLPKYSAGVEIEYSIQEDTVTGYDTSITRYVVTNSYTPETTSVTVTKIWNDNDDQDGLRPLYVEVELYANGLYYDTISLNLGNSWTKTIEGLPKYSNGVEIVYTIEEITVSGYTVAYSGDASSGFTITNTHTPETTSISGTKTWNDNDNNDGKRPDSITIYLYANGSLYATTTASESTSWTYSFTNLPVYSGGVAIDYEIVEAAVEGYTTTYSGYDITNSYTPETTSVTAIKYWDDNNNQDGKRTSYGVTLTGIASVEGVQTVVYTDTQSLSADTLSYTWTNLPVYSSGELITYSVTESTVPSGYTATVTGNASTGFTITNSYTPATTEITVTKVWDDDGNQDGVRPTRVVIQLLANGSVYREVGLTGDSTTGSWSYTFADLPVYSNGTAITYTINELTTIDGYTTTYDGYTITNSHTPETTSVTVTKVWDDSDNQDGIRPSSVTVTLYKDGVSTGYSVTLDSSNNWTYTWSELDKYESGSLIVYNVEEAAVTSYTAVTTGSYNETDGTFSFTVTNSYTPSTIDFSVTKVWDDSDNQDGIRPSSVTVTLTGTTTGGTVYTDTQTLSGSNGWAYTWNDLARYSGGERITYTVVEADVEGYTATYSRTTTPGYTITNTHTPEITTVSAMKYWDDNGNQDGIRDDYEVTITGTTDSYGTVYTDTKALPYNEVYAVWTGLAKYYKGEEITYIVTETGVPEGYSPAVVKADNDADVDWLITNTHTPETVDISVEKIWDDVDDQDGRRPSSITFILRAGGTGIETVTVGESDGWSYEWTGLAKYSNGVEIVYTVDESAVTDYTTSVVNNGDGTFTITNTYVPETTSITVTKVWDDESDQDGIRPSEVTLTLLANGSAYETVTLTTDNATSDNIWAYTFTDLPVYSNGVAITYTVAEVDENGNSTVPDDYTMNGGTYYATGITVTNSHVPETTEITVQKVWDDNSDKNGIRPDSVTLTLYANGEIYETVKLTLTDNATSDSNVWSYTFTDLPLNSGGTAITYTVAEVDGNEESAVPDGYYVSSISDLTDGVIIVTNGRSYDETTSITVSKTWSDGNNRDRTRPESITVALYAGGVATGDTLTLDEGNDWSGEFTDIAKYDSNGDVIEYTVEETDVPEAYTSTVSSIDDGFVITNTYNFETTEISVTKVWNDSNNYDGIRPDSVTIVLYRNGEETVQSITLSADNNWTNSFRSLPANDEDGNAIVYTIGEVTIPGYTVEISGSTSEGFTVTNTHNPNGEPEQSYTSLLVKKVWVDDNDSDGLRPSSVTVALYCNGVATGQTVTLSEANNWTATFTGLLIRNGGVTYGYTVAEVGVPEGYTSTVSGNSAWSYTITNTHEPVTEIEEPEEDTDTDTEAEDDSTTEVSEEETTPDSNPTTGIVLSLLPTAIALLGAVMTKKR